MTTFTPTYSGPMRVEQRPDGSFAILDHNDNLFAVTHSSVDARLIASAPDLLAALQACLCYLEPDADDSQEQQDYSQARLAINKAQSL